MKYKMVRANTTVTGSDKSTMYEAVQAFRKTIDADHLRMEL